MRESIGDVIRRTVKERDLTPYAVAVKAGRRNFTDIRKFLEGSQDIRLSTAESICEALGLALKPEGEADEPTS